MRPKRIVGVSMGEITPIDGFLNHINFELGMIAIIHLEQFLSPIGSHLFENSTLIR